MATTTNYSWTTPDNTAYVKDGASAIRTLGSSVDTTLFGITSGKNVGNVLITAASFSGAATVNVDSCFTSAFKNYLVVLDIRSMTAGAVDMRYRVGGATTSAANYGWANMYSTTSTVSARGTSVTLMNLVPNTGQTAVRGSYTVLGPQTATATIQNGQVTSEAGTIVETFSGGYSLTTVFDGFSLLGTNMTGDVQVFGIRNS